MSNLTKFTEEDIAVGPVLGPEYRASNRMAEAMLEKFQAEHLRPLVDEFADKFREKLWDDVRDWLLSDAEMNVAGEVRHMVEQTISALLAGEEWAMNRYPYADYSKGERVRAAVCKHGGDTILSRRIADLEAELAKKEETIKWMRR
ncbi:hypothetical protein [Rhizorhapis sp.]|uniref:hypothetical protein n=1 Tax=Rhizorhapis sp. TaxID=1968842 RepID=UPI002B491A36|nr:hypothetical protein [Rhizorhapis sp.]HKR17629.1 hypothetical protein [Rhizorhapis sp.]